MNLEREQLLMILVGVAVVFVLFLLLRRRKGPSAPVFKDPRERLKWALGKTRGGLLDGLRRTLGGKLDEDVIGSLEEILLATDIGVPTTQKLLDGLRQAYREGSLKDQRDVVRFLRERLVEKLGESAQLRQAASGPTVILVAGVNGVGKTTSIAKLTKLLADQGKKILLCPSDTFRAAAIDQLKVWAERLGVEFLQGQPGQDPGAVAFDAHTKAKAGGFDYLIVDTAGRLHTNQNLMNELGKIARVGAKAGVPDSPHEALLVIDATTGQNGVRQAAAFKDAIPGGVTGIILAKLDGTAKGGIVVIIREELGIPIKFVGLGEQAADLAPFDAQTFVDGLLPLD